MRADHRTTSFNTCKMPETQSVYNNKKLPAIWLSSKVALKHEYTATEG